MQNATVPKKIFHAEKTLPFEGYSLQLEKSAAEEDVLILLKGNCPILRITGGIHWHETQVDYLAEANDPALFYIAHTAERLTQAVQVFHPVTNVVIDPLEQLRYQLTGSLVPGYGRVLERFYLPDEPLVAELAEDCRHLVVCRQADRTPILTLNKPTKARSPYYCQIDPDFHGINLDIPGPTQQALGKIIERAHYVCQVYQQFIRDLDSRRRIPHGQP